jgi:hypothetical protein
MRRAYGDRLVKLLHEEKAEGVDEAEVARDIGVNERLLNYWKMQGSLPPWKTSTSTVGRRQAGH